ncbi:MAG TPA: metallophosphoesterase, partial [Polyangia bacterium]
SIAFILVAAMVVVTGCGSPTAATNFLCRSCTTNADCGGNPCFTDGTGSQFCGAPCGACPDGFDCQALAGSDGVVVKTCFPVNTSCAATLGGPDMGAGGTGGGGGGGGGGGPMGDMAFIPCTPPTGGNVTATGGTVDRLYFGYTGDTRDSSSSNGYSSGLKTVINNIFTRMKANGVEFALDGGDHMEASSSGEAIANMADYASAAALLGKPVFMTMGNHECETAFNTQDCGYAGAATSDFKMSAFMTQLKNMTGQTLPYYRVDVMTSTGKAVFLSVADDAWNQTQQDWLTAQLTDADTTAKYTFVSKHHPNGNSDQPAFQQIYNLVTSHKITLFLNGHSHLYKHYPSNPRAVVMGLGGAPFDGSQMWWGYLTVMQCPDDRINVQVFDQATGNVQDQFSVPPQ